MISTDYHYAAVGWETLGIKHIPGANECAYDFGITNFNRSWGRVGEGGKEGSCCKGEDFHNRN